jgi:hypothetical protein
VEVTTLNSVGGGRMYKGEEEEDEDEDDSPVAGLTGTEKRA